MYCYKLINNKKKAASGKLVVKSTLLPKAERDITMLNVLIVTAGATFGPPAAEPEIVLLPEQMSVPVPLIVPARKEALPVAEKVNVPRLSVPLLMVTLFTLVLPDRIQLLLPVTIVTLSELPGISAGVLLAEVFQLPEVAPVQV